MKYCIKRIALLIIWISLIPIEGETHPGRTDAKGCHHCWTNCNEWGLSYGEYHCHTPKRSSQVVSRSQRTSSFVSTSTLSQREQNYISILLWQMYYKLKEGQPLSSPEQELFQRYDNDFERLQSVLYQIPYRSSSSKTSVVNIPDTVRDDEGQSRYLFHPEAWYQEQWCSNYQGQTEVVLSDRTRVDCVATIDGIEYAIEFDFGTKWAEAIGQSLYYAVQTLKKPGIVLILERETDYKYLLRLQTTLDYHDLDIKIWVFENYDVGE